LAPAILPLGVVLFVAWLIVRETPWAKAATPDVSGDGDGNPASADRPCVAA